MADAYMRFFNNVSHKTLVISHDFIYASNMFRRVVEPGLPIILAVIGSAC